MRLIKNNCQQSHRRDKVHALSLLPGVVTIPLAYQVVPNGNLQLFFALMTSSGSYVSTGAAFGRVLVRQRHRPEVSPSTLPLYRGPLLAIGLLPIARSPTSSTCDCNDALDLSASRVCIVPLHYSLCVTRVRRDVLRAARIPLSRSPRIITIRCPWIPAIHLCHLSGAEHVMGMCTVR